MRYSTREIFVGIAVVGLACSVIMGLREYNRQKLEDVRISNFMRRDLTSIGLELSLYTSEHSRSEWRDFDEAAQDLQPLRNDDLTIINSESAWEIIESGEDAWGSKLQLEKHGPGKVWLIRSLGPDREIGGGDDIEVEVVLTFH